MMVENYLNKIKDEITGYVLRSRCPGGGFGLYRLKRPSTSDTYYALSILDLLGYTFNDKKTVDYLRGLEDGTADHFSVFSTYCIIRSLQFLGEKPSLDLSDVIEGSTVPCEVEKLPPGSRSIFEKLYYLSQLYLATGYHMDELKRDAVKRFVLRFRKRDGGFGRYIYNLMETMHAVLILSSVGYDGNWLKLKSFLERGKSPYFGFVNVPNPSPSFLEYVHAGVVLSTLIGRGSTSYTDGVVGFIKRCKNPDGGFTRSGLGPSSLEYTYYGVHSIKMLK